MVDAGLTPFGTRIARADNADEGPPALDLGHEWATRITLARVLASVVVAGAHHLVVDDDPDALVAMPALALAVVDGGNVNNLMMVTKCVEPYKHKKALSPHGNKVENKVFIL
jgi:hypothetical protein